MISGPHEGVILRAGVGKVDITCREQGTWDTLLPAKVKQHIPPDYLRKPIEVSDPLYVRALVLDDGQMSLVLLTLDVTAIAARTISQDILSDSADDFLPRLRQRVERELGVPGGGSASVPHTRIRCLACCATMMPRSSARSKRSDRRSAA